MIKSLEILEKLGHQLADLGRLIAFVTSHLNQPLLNPPRELLLYCFLSESLVHEHDGCIVLHVPDGSPDCLVECLHAEVFIEVISAETCGVPCAVKVFHLFLDLHGL